MVYSVHIASVGFVHEPITGILGSGIQCDRIHLLWNDHPLVAKNLKISVERFISTGYSEEQIVCHEIDPLDYTGTLKTVVKIVSEDKNRFGNKTEFFINITLGTSVITASLCTAAFMSGSQMYYKLDEKKLPADTPKDGVFIMIPTPKLPDLESMSSKRKEFIKQIEKNQPCSIQSLSDFGSKQNINQFINYFVKANLVKREHDGRTVNIRLTDLGAMVCQWII